MQQPQAEFANPQPLWEQNLAPVSARVISEPVVSLGESQADQRATPASPLARAALAFWL